MILTPSIGDETPMTLIITILELLREKKSNHVGITSHMTSSSCIDYLIIILSNNKKIKNKSDILDLVTNLITINV